MSKEFIHNNILQGVADAIRFCDNTTDSIAPKDYAKRIRGLFHIYEEKDLDDNDVALVVETDYGLKFIKIEDVDKVDLTAYTLKPYVRFHRGKNGRSVAIHKAALSNRMYAASNKYKLFCNLTSDGSFTWAVTVNRAASGGTVSWTAANNPTLSDIVTQLNNGRNSGTTSDYLSFAVDNASNPTYIKVTQRTYSHSTFTLSNNTGGTLVDLSFYCRIGGVQQSETHRTWQAQDVVTMFPNSGFLPSNTRQYSVSGLNLSYRCGGNETRYKTYYTSNGTSSYLAEDSVSGRMSPSAFAALNGDGNATHQALYDKYEGSWEAYMAASMVKIDDTHSNGIEYQSYDNGDTQTAFLASVTTMDFDGSYVPAFPRAYAAYNIVDTDLGHNHLSTNHEIAVFMRDEKLAKINAAIAYIGGGNALSVTAYYWSVAQCTSGTAWLYYGGIGTLGNGHKYGSYGGRSLVYLN